MNSNSKQPTTLPRTATMPMPTKMHSKPMPAVNHPAVAEYVTQWNDMAHELDRMHAERDRLANELEIERRANAELQHSVDLERAAKERFQRYAVSLNTFVSTLHSVATQALDESQKAALTEPPKQVAPPISEDEMIAGVAEIAAKFAPKQDEAK